MKLRKIALYVSLVFIMAVALAACNTENTVKVKLVNFGNISVNVVQDDVFDYSSYLSVKDENDNTYVVTVTVKTTAGDAVETSYNQFYAQSAEGYVITCSVTIGALSYSRTITVNVESVLGDPIVRFDGAVAEGVVNTLYNLPEASAVDTAGNTLTPEYTLFLVVEGGTNVDKTSSITSSHAFTPDTAGKYLLTATATDAQDGTASASVYFYVRNAMAAGVIEDFSAPSSTHTLANSHYDWITLEEAAFYEKWGEGADERAGVASARSEEVTWDLIYLYTRFPLTEAQLRALEFDYIYIDAFIEYKGAGNTDCEVQNKGFDLGTHKLNEWVRIEITRECIRSGLGYWETEDDFYSDMCAESERGGELLRVVVPVADVGKCTVYVDEIGYGMDTAIKAAFTNPAAGSAGKPYSLPTAYVRNQLGDISIAYELYSVNGQTETKITDWDRVNHAFTPSAEGEYKLIAAITDSKRGNAQIEKSIHIRGAIPAGILENFDVPSTEAYISNYDGVTGDYYGEFEGRTGVAATKAGSSSWVAAVNVSLPLTLAEFTALNFDYIYVKAYIKTTVTTGYAVYIGAGDTWGCGKDQPGVNKWINLVITAEDIDAAFGSRGEFNTAMTQSGGGGLFWIYQNTNNAKSFTVYIDEIGYGIDAPDITLATAAEGIVNTQYTLPVATVTNSTANIVYTLFAPNGDDITSSVVSGKFTPAVSGNYKLIATVNDPARGSGTAERIITVNDIPNIPEGEFESYSYGFEGDEYTLPEAVMTNAAIGDVSVTYKLYTPNNVDITDEIENGRFTPSVAGEYKLVAIINDSVRGEGTVETYITIREALAEGVIENFDIEATKDLIRNADKYENTYHSTFEGRDGVIQIAQPYDGYQNVVKFKLTGDAANLTENDFDYFYAKVYLKYNGTPNPSVLEWGIEFGDVDNKRPATNQWLELRLTVAQIVAEHGSLEAFITKMTQSGGGQIFKVYEWWAVGGAVKSFTFYVDEIGWTRAKPDVTIGAAASGIVNTQYTLPVATVTNSTANIVYTLFAPNGDDITSSVVSGKFTPAVTGNYKLVATVNDPVRGIGTAERIITINDAPDLPQVEIADAPDGTTGSEYTLPAVSTANDSIGDVTVTYILYAPDGTDISDLITAGKFTPVAAGKYRVVGVVNDTVRGEGEAETEFYVRTPLGPKVIEDFSIPSTLANATNAKSDWITSKNSVYYGSWGEGANERFGVVEAFSENVTWNLAYFRVIFPMTKAELMAISFDYIYVNMYIKYTGAQTSAVVQCGDDYPIGTYNFNEWITVRVSLADCVANGKYASKDAFCDAMTGEVGGELIQVRISTDIGKASILVDEISWGMATPNVTIGAAASGIVNTQYALPVATVTNSTANIVYTLFAPNGDDITSSVVSGKFTPAVSGNYKLIATVNDPARGIGTAERIITVNDAPDLPEGEFESYSYGFEGDEYTLPEAVMTNAAMGDVSVTYKLYTPNNVDITDEIENGRFTPSVAGEYKLVAIINDSVRGEGTVETYITIREALAAGVIENFDIEATKDLIRNADKYENTYNSTFEGRDGVIQIAQPYDGYQNVVKFKLTGDAANLTENDFDYFYAKVYLKYNGTPNPSVLEWGIEFGDVDNKRPATNQWLELRLTVAQIVAEHGSLEAFITKMTQSGGGQIFKVYEWWAVGGAVKSFTFYVDEIGWTRAKPDVAIADAGMGRLNAEYTLPAITVTNSTESIVWSLTAPDGSDITGSVTGGKFTPVQEGEYLYTATVTDPVRGVGTFQRKILIRSEITGGVIEAFEASYTLSTITNKASGYSTTDAVYLDSWTPSDENEERTGVVKAVSNNWNAGAPLMARFPMSEAELRALAPDYIYIDVYIESSASTTGASFYNGFSYSFSCPFNTWTRVQIDVAACVTINAGRESGYPGWSTMNDFYGGMTSGNGDALFYIYHETKGAQYTFYVDEIGYGYNA